MAHRTHGEMSGDMELAQTKRSFEEVALPHLDAVYQMARRLCRNEAEAEDLAQEAYLRAYKAFGRFDLRSYGAKPWLLKILHNVFYTHKGKQRRQPTLLDDVDFDSFAAELDSPTPVVDGVSSIRWDEVDEELKEAVAALPEDYREVLLLWSIEEMAYKEIAEVCGCPVGTVMSRLYRARQLLGRKLVDYASEHNLSKDRFGQ